MANWCSNWLSFEGTEENLSKLNKIFEDMESENSKGESHILPSGQEAYFGEVLEFCSDGFSYESKWGPNTDAVVEIADMCNVSFKLEFDEPGGGMFGLIKYEDKKLTYYNLIDEDIKLASSISDDDQQVDYDGDLWDNESELKERMLELLVIQQDESDRKRELAMSSPSYMHVREMLMDEKEYRAYPALSYSRLSDIEKIGIDAVNASANNIGKLRGVVLGSIVDDIISNKLSKTPIYIVKVNKIPGNGTITELAIEAIVKDLYFTNFINLDSLTLENYLVANRFMKNGMNSTNFHEKLVNYNEYINALKYAKEDTQIVTEFDYKILIKSAQRLRNQYPLFSSAFVNNKNESLDYQTKFLATINGLQIKCMLDAIHFDHVAKTIKPLDIKTGAMSKGDYESFYHEAYLRYNYYIQAGLYRKIAIEYFKNHTTYHDYEVLEFEFVYSTTNPKTSLSEQNLYVHTISTEEYKKSFKGFDYLDEQGMPACKLGIGELVRFYKENKTILTGAPVQYASIA
jgi:hypothetical protein